MDWDWTIWGALTVAVLGTFAGIVFLVVRLLKSLRALKRLRRRLARELNTLADSLERLADAAERASDQRRLEESLARLQRTRAQAAVLNEAFDEATRPLRRLAWLLR
jgi:hypothetical protein